MNWIKIASLLMFFAVALGAFGAHGLKSKLSEHYFDVFKTGVLYHALHALALFAVAWVSTQTPDHKVHLAGYFFVLGVFLFSGSLYGLSITQFKPFAFLTPFGGLSFLMGWVLLFLSKTGKL